jgi:hypothetical protein
LVAGLACGTSSGGGSKGTARGLIGGSIRYMTHSHKIPRINVPTLIA